jgi:tetracycline resistance efflux pump
MLRGCHIRHYCYTLHPGDTLSPVWVPVLVFLVTGAVTYFIGSSWGAWALMMPVAIPLAVTTGAAIPLTAAAVLSGGTFGDVTSPVSGMTAMSAGAAEADHMKYVRAMTPYNMTAAVMAAGLFAVVPFFLS